MQSTNQNGVDLSISIVNQNFSSDMISLPNVNRDSFLQYQVYLNVCTERVQRTDIKTKLLMQRKKIDCWLCWRMNKEGKSTELWTKENKHPKNLRHESKYFRWNEQRRRMEMGFTWPKLSEFQVQLRCWHDKPMEKKITFASMPIDSIDMPEILIFFVRSIEWFRLRSSESACAKRVIWHAVQRFRWMSNRKHNFILSLSFIARTNSL